MIKLIDSGLWTCPTKRMVSNNPFARSFSTKIRPRNHPSDSWNLFDEIKPVCRQLLVPILVFLFPFLLLLVLSMDGCVLTSGYFLANRLHWLHRHGFSSFLSFHFVTLRAAMILFVPSKISQNCENMAVKSLARQKLLVGEWWVVSRFDLVSPSLHTNTQSSLLMAVSSH